MIKKILIKKFRKTSINKEYLDLCRLVQKYPEICIGKVRQFFYCNYIENRYKHLGWFCKFTKKYGLSINVRG